MRETDSAQERVTDRETERHKHTDRQTDRQTQKEMHVLEYCFAYTIPFCLIIPKVHPVILFTFDDTFYIS